MSRSTVAVVGAIAGACAIIAAAALLFMGGVMPGPGGPGIPESSVPQEHRDTKPATPGEPGDPDGSPRRTTISIPSAPGFTKPDGS